jgi:hypothetical protein
MILELLNHIKKIQIYKRRMDFRVDSLLSFSAFLTSSEGRGYNF